MGAVQLPWALSGGRRQGQLQGVEEALARPQPCTETCEMIGVDLTVDEGKVPGSSWRTRWTNATFEASGCRANIDSPKKAEPSETP